MKKHKLSYKKRIRISSIDVIKNSSNILYYSALRLSIEPQYYADFLTELENYPYKLTKLLTSKTKKSIEELDADSLVELEPHKEVSWAKTVIFRSSKLLNEFVIESQNFSHNLLLGDYEAAEKALEYIEENFGQSLWLIKNKTAFLQLTKGLESQKLYTKEIKEKLSEGSLLKFLVHWVSVRNEASTTISRFSNQVENIINSFDQERMAGYKEYCQYHLLEQENFDLLDFIKVLNQEYSSSIFDYYEAFVCVLRLMLLHEDRSFKLKAHHILKEINSLIDDPRLKFLESTFSNAEIFQGFESICCLDAYLQDDFENAYTLATDALRKNPADSVLIAIEAYAMVALNRRIPEQDNITSKLIDNILNYLTCIISNGFSGAAKEVNEIYKISINFAALPWTNVLNIIVNKEILPCTSTSEVSPVSVYKIPFFHPWLIDSIADIGVRDAYRAKCQNYNTLSMQYYNSMHFNEYNYTLPFGKWAKDYLHGIVSYNLSENGLAISSGRELLQSEIYKLKGITLMSYASLRQNNLDETLPQVCQLYLTDKDLYAYLPIREIYELIKPGTVEWKKASQLLDFSIILDAYVNYYNKEGETELSFAYEDFLIESGINKPSELVSIIGRFNKEKIIYYLRNICIQNNMDISTAFAGGSGEVIEERLKICRILIDIDPINADDYKYEIKDLLRQQVITSRRQEVDQSRIYVDLASVRQQSKNELQESYERYLAYVKYGINNHGGALSINEKKGDNINVPNNEANALLLTMIEEVIDAYISPHIGLDRFLSTRIRHGILENHLRRPLQNHNLITQKGSKNGPYLDNEYWHSKLKITDKRTKAALNKALSSFSESYDTLISTITNEWLQVKSSKKQYGLFDFKFKSPDIKSLSEIITPDTPFKEFIDAIINRLETTLILQLFSIREKLNRDAKPKAKILINSLYEQIDSLPITHNEILSAINQGRTDMQSQFDKIIEWFVPSASGNSTPYNMYDPLYVAGEIVKEASPLFRLNIESEDEDFSMHGQLPIFVDIFVNIFENVIKRSGLLIPIAEAKGEIEHTESGLTIVSFTVINDLGPSVNSDLLDEELKRRKTLLGGDYSQYLATEGKSGLFKIHKSVGDFNAIGFDYKPVLDFGVLDNKFFVTIKVPFKVFTLDIDEAI